MVCCGSVSVRFVGGCGRCCGSGDIETIDHILTECPNPKLKELRTQAKLEVEKMWAGQGEMQAWSLHDWITPGKYDRRSQRRIETMEMAVGIQRSGPPQSPRSHPK